MCKLRLFFHLLLLINLSTFSQEKVANKSILIFSNEPGYLRPYIETTVKELKDINFNEPYFSKVSSLNNFDEDSNIRSRISKILWEQENSQELVSTRPTNNADIQFQDEIINRLTGYDYFLTVKTNTLGELIEFQFQLFRTLKSKSKNGKNFLKRVLVDNEIGVENFFVNPKEPGYLKEISNAIQRLFQYSNKIPEAKLFILNEEVKHGDTLVLPLNSNILFDGSNSGDFDSEIIQYQWRNIPEPNEKYQTFNKLPFEKNKEIQNITINSSGSYKVGFRVFDGVNYSEEIIFNVNTIKEPIQIQILDSTSYSYHYSNLFNLKPSISQHSEIFFDSKEITPNQLNNIYLSNKLIKNRFLKEENLRNLDSVRIEKYNDNKISVIKFKSEFPAPEINRKNNLYLYSLGENNLLSEPIKIEHKLVYRSPFILYLNIGPVELSSKGESLLTHDGTPINLNNVKNAGVSFIDINLGASLLITENIEFGASIGLINSQKAFFSNYQVDMSSKFNLWSYYTLLTNGRFNPYIGLQTGFYTFSNIALNDNKSIVNSFGGKLGAKYILTQRSNLFIEIAYSEFLKNELSDLYMIKLGFGYLIRL